ncbi:MAG: Rap1a/Tai family immunity protein [Limnohabitans sp.]
MKFLKFLPALGFTGLALMVFSEHVYANKSLRFLTAGELQASLLSESENIRFNGRNYIMGVVDALMLTKALPVCMDEKTEINAITDLVRIQMQQRSDLQRYNAASVVREVMAANFPCV